MLERLRGGSARRDAVTALTIMVMIGHTKTTHADRLCAAAAATNTLQWARRESGAGAGGRAYRFDPARPAGVAFNEHAQGARLNGAVRPTPHLAKIGISVRARVVRVRIGVCVRACPRACLHVAPNYWATREPWTTTVRSAQERARAPALPLKRLRGQNRLWSAPSPPKRSVNNALRFGGACKCV